MSHLPAHREVFLRLWVRADLAEADAVRAHLTTELSRFGAVNVESIERYAKDSEFLDINVELVPPVRVADCVAALRALSPDGWEKSPMGLAWRTAAGRRPFLHPRLRTAGVDWVESWAPRRFTAFDVVRILDCPHAREHDVVGREAVIGGYTFPGDVDDVWSYSVALLSAVEQSGFEDAEHLHFEDSQLTPTGTRVPAPSQPASRLVVSVNPEGRITS